MSHESAKRSAVADIDFSGVVDLASARLFLAALAGWLNARQLEAMAYLIEENRILRGQLRGRLGKWLGRSPSARSRFGF